MALEFNPETAHTEACITLKPGCNELIFGIDFKISIILPNEDVSPSESQITPTEPSDNLVPPVIADNAGNFRQDQLPEPLSIAYPQFSFFDRPIKNVIPSKSITIRDAYDLIKGPAYKKVTDQLREIKNEEEQRNFKKKRFDYVTFSGIFNRRDDKHLKQHSGLLVIDFDHIYNPSELAKLKEQLLSQTELETALLYLSPRGNGLKWIVEIDINKYTHLDWFKAIQHYIQETFKRNIDTGSDISRACFLAHDPNVYINPKYT